jgi:hypothetical protein
MTPRAQDTLYFENQAGHLYYHPAGFVRLAWATGRLPVAVIQVFYEQVLELLISTDCRRLLSEHGLRAPLPQQAQQWLTDNWIPRAIARSHTRHCAIVEGADPMHRLSTQSVVSTAPAGFVFKRFDNVPAAEQWLLAVK